MSIADARVRQSPSGSEEAFIRQLLTTTGTIVGDLEKDFQAFANNLESHLRLVKERAQQQQFRINVLRTQDYKCAVCDFDIPVALEAAHIIPKERNGTDDARNGISLCACHHKIFDANLFCINPDTLEIVPYGSSLQSLGISHPDIKHLRSIPHKKALSWRWDRRKK